VDHVDAIAEIPGSLRRGTAVKLKAITVATTPSHKGSSPSKP
jgi:hypothetical protein